MPLHRIIFTQAAFLIFVSTVFGLARPFLPHGISWKAHWPTSSTSAEEAYRMMAKPGDPPFIGLPEVISLQENKEAVLLDARSKEEFAKGRIPGARNLPFYELATFQEKALSGLTGEAPLIIYCEGIGCELSFFLGRELTAGGFKNVHIFYGGYPEWSGAGLPIEK